MHIYACISCLVDTLRCSRPLLLEEDTCMYPPPHMAHTQLLATVRSKDNMSPPPHMACMYPPPHMACMYPPPHIQAVPSPCRTTCLLLLMRHACILLLICHMAHTQVLATVALGSKDMGMVRNGYVVGEQQLALVVSWEIPPYSRYVT